MTQRIFLCGALLASAIYGQYAASVNGSSTGAAEINGKINWQTSTGACAGLSGTVGKDFCTDTVTGFTYKVSVSGSPATWEMIVGATDTQTLTNKSINAGEVNSGTLPHTQLPALLSADIPNNAANTSGQAGTALALAATPVGCPYPASSANAIAANGNLTCLAKHFFTDFRVGCQSTIGGSNFDSAGGVGTQATATSCDGADGSLDGYVDFPAGSTAHIQGHLYLPSTFQDGVAVNIADWNTTATGGAAVFGIATQCVAVGGLASATGYGSYTTFTSSTAQGTASHRNTVAPVTLTTGCTPDSMLYFDLELTSGNNTLGADARVKWLRVGVIE